MEVLVAGGREGLNTIFYFKSFIEFTKEYIQWRLEAQMTLLLLLVS